MMTHAKLSACVSLVVAAGLLLACSGTEPAAAVGPDAGEVSPGGLPARRLLPVADMVSAGGPGNGEGWTPVGSVTDRPALSLYENRHPIMVLTCEGVQTAVQVRGLQPKQAWPQPPLTVQFGTATRTKVPDVRNIGEQVAYDIKFPIADDVLEQIGANAPITVAFNGQSRTFPPFPDDRGREFAEGCAALVPAGMRRAARP